MENLQHDPRTKQQIKDALYGMLYDPVHRSFKNRINDLIIRNTVIGGHSHKSFIYKGVFYDCDTDRPPLRKNRLATQLKPEMEEYLADLKALNEEEIPFVRGFIIQVLNASDSLTDYLKVFPESMHYPLQSLITSYPGHSPGLDETQVKQLKQKNEKAINLLKQRMVKNLLL